MYGNEAKCGGYAETVAADVLPVPGAVANISYEQEVLAGLIGDLQSRLGSILRPIPPADAKTLNGGTAVHSELHGKLTDLVTRQSAMNSSLRSLIDRLTV